jgi:hypothetical protein
MGAFLVPVLLVLIVVVIAVAAIKRFSSDTVAQSDRLQATDRPTLRYLVPPGQDPAVVLAALRSEGFDASPDSEPGPSSPIVIIGADVGALDREAVRATLVLLDETNINPDESGSPETGRVRFLDE